MYASCDQNNGRGIASPSDRVFNWNWASSPAHWPISHAAQSLLFPTFRAYPLVAWGEEEESAFNCYSCANSSDVSSPERPLSAVETNGTEIPQLNGRGNAHRSPNTTTRLYLSCNSNTWRLNTCGQPIGNVPSIYGPDMSSDVRDFCTVQACAFPCCAT